MDWLSPQSYWHQSHTHAVDASPPLEDAVSTDVVVIGGGITGLTAASNLRSAGRDVVILEAGRIGAGTTGGTSGHLDAHPEQGARRLINDYGIDSARTVTAARMQAIDQIEQRCGGFEGGCDFRRVPAYLYSETIEGIAALRDECDALRELGLAVSRTSSEALPLKNAGAYRIENQGRFHSMKYLTSLAERLRRDGCQIFEHTPARPPKEAEGDLPCSVNTANGKVRARNALVCTHSVFLGMSLMDLRIAPYQSYVITVRVADELPDALFWDDQNPYHYIRLASADDPHLLIVGGEDHKTGQGDDERDAFSGLEQFTRERFAVKQVEQRWSAEFFEPADGLPYAGLAPLSEHVYISTGYSGTGLTFGTVAGELLAALVLGNEPSIARIFSPARVMAMAGGKSLIMENFNAARHFVTDRFIGDKVESLEQVPSGIGRLVRYKGRQMAVFREEKGTVHALSPVCTHMGCHVQWNEAELTWDCPCHGGRFSPQGERLYGPPASDLKPIPPEEL